MSTLRFRRRTLYLVPSFLALLGSAPAFASPTFYTSDGSFTAATAGTSFTSQGFETPFAPANTLLFPGLVISCSNCAAGRTGTDPTAGVASLGINGGNPVTFSFTDPVTAFGFYIRDFGTLSATSLALSANGTTSTLLSNFTGTSGNTMFFGVADSQPFTSVTLSGGVSGDNYYLDNLSFGAQAAVTAPPSSAVPEPGTWAMLMLGFGLIGAVARRRTSLRHAAIA